MKLTQFVPAFAATFVLAACSTAGNVVSGATEAVSNTAGAVTETVSTVGTAVSNTVTGSNVATNTVNSVATAGGDAVKNTKVLTETQKIATTSKTVVYRCLNKTTITANYAFDGETPKAVNLRVGKKAINGLVYDGSDKDFAAFKSSRYSWSLDEGFSFANADKTGGMLTKLGKKTDQIMGKQCKVDSSATKRMNKS